MTDCIGGKVVIEDVNYGTLWRRCPRCGGKGCYANAAKPILVDDHRPTAEDRRQEGHHWTKTPDAAGVRGMWRRGYET
jgi:hypothetical protein